MKILAVIPNDNLNRDFLFYFLDYTLPKEVKRLVQGGQPNLNGAMIKNLSVILPCIEEQTAIAAILTQADEEIRLLREKERALQAQKKGLMQRLLTGKIRVKT